MNALEEFVDTAADVLRRSLVADLQRRLCPVLLRAAQGDMVLALDGKVVLADCEGMVAYAHIRDAADALTEILGTGPVLEVEVPPEVTASDDWTYNDLLRWWSREQKRRAEAPNE